MALTDQRPHFVQVCEGPVFIGPGHEVLACACVNTLIEGYDPARWLAVAIRCGACGEITETPGLPEGATPPFAVVIAEPNEEARVATTTMPAHTYVIGRGEMDRIIALLSPVNPPSNIYEVTPGLLDQVESIHLEKAGVPVPAVTSELKGLQEHALGWAVALLRERMRDEGWSWAENSATTVACDHVCAFLHFAATWGHHPVFPAMLATAGETGFSLHGLAPFAAAHCLSQQRNRIAFPPPEGYPGRVEHFLLATGPTDTVPVYTRVFNRFEFPFGQAWDAAKLKSAVQDLLAAEKGRINPRHPGVLLISPGCAWGDFDEALIRAAQAAMHTVGRDQRGLMAAAPIVLRLWPGKGPHEVQFGYGFFPVINRHYQGEVVLG